MLPRGRDAQQPGFDHFLPSQVSLTPCGHQRGLIKVSLYRLALSVSLCLSRLYLYLLSHSRLKLGSVSPVPRGYGKLCVLLKKPFKLGVRVRQGGIDCVFIVGMQSCDARTEIEIYIQ